MEDDSDKVGCLEDEVRDGRSVAGPQEEPRVI
jgi:hypothetical protein